MTERLPRFRPDELDRDQRDLYGRVLGGPRATTARIVELTDQDGGLYGPFNPWLLAPAFGRPLETLGAAIRFDSMFPARLLELAILAVANHVDSPFERYAHEAIGRAAGVSDADIDALRDGSIPPSCDEHERAVIELTLELLNTGDLSDESHERAVDRLGERRLFELVTLIGFYSMLAMQLRVYRVEPPQP